MSHEVYFILDETFDADLWAPSRKTDVRVIKSPHNEAAARAVWEKESDAYSPLSGIATFDGSADVIRSFYDLLGTIDQHHGNYSAQEPWSTIHVVGSPQDAARPDRIADELCVEAVSLEPEGGGCAIKRVAQRGDARDGAPRRR